MAALRMAAGAPAWSSPPARSLRASLIASLRRRTSLAKIAAPIARCVRARSRARSPLRRPIGAIGLARNPPGAPARAVGKTSRASAKRASIMAADAVGLIPRAAITLDRYGHLLPGQRNPGARSARHLCTTDPSDAWIVPSTPVRTSLDELRLLLKTSGRLDEQLTADLGEAVIDRDATAPRDAAAPPAPPGCDPVNVPAAPQLIVNVTVCGFSADALVWP